MTGGARPRRAATAKGSGGRAQLVRRGPWPGEALWQEVEYGSYDVDLPLWRELAEGASAGRGNPVVLELGCGTGRVSIDLAKRGCSVTGLDVSPELMAALQDRARELGVAINAVVADACSFELPARFDLVLAPMQLAQLVGSKAERTAMLACIARHLKPSGRAALALIDRYDEFGPDDPPLLPDIRDIDGWIYASQPVEIRPAAEGAAIELHRVRGVVSPSGDKDEQPSCDTLALLSCDELEEEASLVGLVADARRTVPATEDHVASAVVILRSDD